VGADPLWLPQHGRELSLADENIVSRYTFGLSCLNSLVRFNGPVEQAPGRTVSPGTR
jgi:hypothetical protein